LAGSHVIVLTFQVCNSFMKNNVILVNTARGVLIDEVALADALENEKNQE